MVANMKKKIPTLKKTPRKKLFPQFKVNVAISVGSFDIYIDLLEIMDEFIENNCIFGLCPIKKGGSLSRLHIQMVC